MFLADLASNLRYKLPHTGRGMRWLKEELRARRVTVTITESAMREFVEDAESAASAQGWNPPEPYASRLRKAIAARAEFLHMWTMSDNKIDTTDATQARLTGLARKYALPRGWLVSEPMVIEYPRRGPVYARWASASP
ncbi:MAG TPA: hypothetical protein VIL32_00030 [Steroidobacteraceae bacterium]